MPIGIRKAKPAAAKPKAAAKTPAKRTPAKKAPAAKAAPAKRAPAKKAAAKAEPQRTNRSPKTDLTQAQLKKILGPIERNAKSRDKNYEAWKTDVQSVNEGIIAALDAEVPVNLIVGSADVSRQHVYKIIGDMQTGARNATGQTNGSSGRKPSTGKTAPVKRAATKAPATTAKRTIAKKPAAKAAAPKRTIKKRG